MPPVPEHFSPSGPLAAALGASFELRPQQAKMARAVANAIESRTTILVEAGTGVGKSFAYLIPAIQRLIDTAGAERILVATNTIALQEQLVRKDIPALLPVFGEGASVVRPELVKGRGNYLSLRRLQLASGRQERLFLDEPARRSLHVIENWAYTTPDGSLSTLPALERAGIWDRVQSDAGNCMGRRCPTYDKCFYQNARRRMERANLLICNHALFFSDLALRRNDAAFLPDYQHVIFDEAHGVEDAAGDHFGLSLAEGRVRHLLAALYQPKRARGFLAALSAAADQQPAVDRAIALVHGAGDAADEFFASLAELVGGEIGALRVTSRGAIPNTISHAFTELAGALKRLKDAPFAEEDRFELNAYWLRAAAIADEAEALLQQHLEGCAYWIETSPSDSRGLRVTLACAPVEVSPILSEHLFAKGRSVVLTSATLATGKGSFEHAKARLGCQGALSLLLGSPFDHARQVELHLDSTMPDPRASSYSTELARRILDHVKATRGGAFVLFTSFHAMNQAGAILRPELEALGLPVFIHGQDGSRAHILESFRASGDAVLLGTNSFWQGVDVPGQALRNVIITRLPFDPPDRPLTQARLEAIEARAGNPFMEESLPRAIIRFKQGFGRLIRTASDSGRVVVLDPRIATARYGRLFIDALPSGVRVIHNGEPVEIAPTDA